MEFNLIATTDKINAGKACSQLWMNLRAVDDPEPKVNKTRVRGIIQATTNRDPIEGIYKLRAHMAENPGRYDAMYRILPILAQVETSIENIVEEVRRQSERIGENESFRITVEKRNTEMRTHDIIDAVAVVIDRAVDLGNPDWVVLIEVLGDTTGVSVIKPDTMISVQKEVYELSTKPK